MKKIIFLITILFLILAIAVPLAKINAQTNWSLGSQSEEIRNLQEILKTDPTIYPEGLVTGYFGPITQRAIQRVQARCGLPQNGVVDEETRRCIFPIDYKVKVISPNGGENWDRSQIQIIKWTLEEPSSRPVIHPLWSQASIDLFKRETSLGIPVFVKHIATVNMFSLAYPWRIPNSIPNGENYLVRISIGLGNIVPPPTIPPIKATNWDESDAVFQISGVTTSPTECKGVLEVIKALENVVVEINKAIALLKQMSGE